VVVGFQSRKHQTRLLVLLGVVRQATVATLPEHQGQAVAVVAQCILNQTAAETTTAMRLT